MSNVASELEHWRKIFACTVVLTHPRQKLRTIALPHLATTEDFFDVIRCTSLVIAFLSTRPKTPMDHGQCASR